jgi:DNA-3-methyladenine glycosylase II
MTDEIKKHFAKDPVMQNLLQTITLENNSEPGGVYTDLLSSIISQQLSNKAANAIKERFLNLFPGRYPQPYLLLATQPEVLRGIGLSRQKLGYLKNVATFFIENDLMERDFSKMGDETLISLFTKIKGVGRWTAEMILMFTLKRPDIFPIDDLGIRTAMAKLYHLDLSDKKQSRKLQEIAETWKPYRSYACFLLWQYKDS